MTREAGQGTSSEASEKKLPDSATEGKSKKALNIQNPFPCCSCPAPSQSEENKSVFLMTKPDLMINPLGFSGGSRDSDRWAGGRR
jgi:hypothetical protein